MWAPCISSGASLCECGFSPLVGVTPNEASEEADGWIRTIIRLVGPTEGPEC